MGSAPPRPQGAPPRLPNGREGEGEGRRRIPLRLPRRRPRPCGVTRAGGCESLNQPSCHGRAGRGTLCHGPRVRVKAEGGLRGNAPVSGTLSPPVLLAASGGRTRWVRLCWAEGVGAE